MDWLVDGLDVLDNLLRIENSDVVLLNRGSFEVVNVSDSAVGDLAEFEFWQIHATSPMLFLQSSADREWTSVSVSRPTGAVGVDVWMGIDPDNFEVWVLDEGCENSRT